MYMHTLRDTLLEMPVEYRVVLDFGGVRRGIRKVRASNNRILTIIEAGDPEQTVAAVIAALLNQERYASVQLFEVSGDSYGYYDVAEIMQFDIGHMVLITAGAFLDGDT